VDLWKQYLAPAGLEDFTALEQLPGPVRDQGLGLPRVRFDIQRQGEYEYFVFVNELNYRFPLLQAGTYILRSQRFSGLLDQLKIFLHSGQEETFIRVHSQGRRSRLELLLQGEVVYRDIVLPFTLEQVFLMPFDDLRRYLGRRIDWDFVFPESRESDRRVVAFVQGLREALVPLPEVEDGAMDAQGRFVRIADETPQVGPQGFNCSGFAKWVLDGMVEPLLGRYLELGEVKNRQEFLRNSSLSRSWEYERDPFFGLDWTRTLALILDRARRSPNPRELVFDWSFYSRIAPEEWRRLDVDTVPFLAYTENRGYPMGSLEAVLYHLAVSNPGRLYLASVNGDFGTNPVMNQHRHVAIIAPWINDSGTLETAVFEVNGETSLPYLASRYSRDYVHLVSLPVVGNLNLPNLEGIQNRE